MIREETLGWGLVLAAAGAGCRFGTEVPKQFQLCDDRPVYLSALEPFIPYMDEVVVVVPEAWKDRVIREISSAQLAVRIHVEEGGVSRHDSVSRGVNGLSERVEYVVVHDAARPFVKQSLIRRVLAETLNSHACVPVVTVTDTVKELGGGGVVIRTLERNSIGLAQTPQGFQLALLRKALRKAAERGFQATDEAMLVEELGRSVTFVEGDPDNLKITWPQDLASSRMESGDR